MPYFTTGATKLWFECCGEGAPLLMLPGLGMSVDDWGPLPAVLAQRRHVVLLEPRGAGRSDGPSGDYSIELLANDAAALLAHLDLPRCPVFGVSMGGHIALALALAYPERVERIILAFTSDHTPPTGRARLRQWSAARSRGAREHLEAVSLWLFDDRFCAEPGQPEAWVDAVLGAEPSPPHPGFGGQVAACLAWDVRDRVGSIEAPALVLAGDQDLIFPLTLTTAFAARLPRSKLVTLPCGHVPLGAAGPEYERQILEFLSS